MTKNPTSPFTKNSNRLLLIMATCYVAILLLLSSWWAYLMVDLGHRLGASENRRIWRIITWEGGTFIILLLALFLSFMVLYLREQQKTKSLQAFFAGLTHELKTPLASIRLQGEVLSELVSSYQDNKLQTITSRMAQDVAKLETQMDKILQLSRLERGGPLSPVPVPLKKFFNSVAAKVMSDLHFEWSHSSNEEVIVSADEFALELIIKNLIENTKGHTKSRTVKLQIVEMPHKVSLLYQDEGVFAGNKNKLGELFYKHNSSRGSGIGLYLISGLMKRMGGEASFDANSSLITTLSFKKGGKNE